MTEGGDGRTLRDWFIDVLGIEVQRKEKIYLDVSASANLRDATYWLEILFSAGIATLGLTLNSPAVIIGAMLISPLMGPILANGLALAAGDLLLAIRASVNLIISAGLAVGFATILVILLPFREMTAEISARTQPNTLDLVIALFSGAVGSIAICKNVRGVTTSIPGVAIAVALMPPLCVVGYGIGLMITLGRAEGASVVGGGGLLFLTNLVAITFTAMLTFLLFHIDSEDVKKKIRDHRLSDRESRRLQRIIDTMPLPGRVKAIGSLPGRLLLVSAFILALFFPLSRSFDTLKSEIAHHQFENALQKRAAQVWQKAFAKFPDGSERSYIDTFSAAESGGHLKISLRVFTSRPYSDEERAEFVREIASLLHRVPASIEFSLIEIPTSRFEIATRAKPEPLPPAPPTLAEMVSSLAARIDAAVAQVHLPAPALLLGYTFQIRRSGPSIEIAYLSDRPITEDAQKLLEEELERLTSDPSLTVTLHYIARTFTISFEGRSTALSPDASREIGTLRDLLTEHAGWRAAVGISAKDRRRTERLTAVTAPLIAGGITKERIGVTESAQMPSNGEVSMRIVVPPAPGPQV